MFFSFSYPLFLRCSFHCSNVRNWFCFLAVPVAKVLFVDINVHIFCTWSVLKILLIFSSSIRQVLVPVQVSGSNTYSWLLQVPMKWSWLPLVMLQAWIVPVIEVLVPVQPAPVNAQADLGVVSVVEMQLGCLLLLLSLQCFLVKHGQTVGRDAGCISAGRSGCWDAVSGWCSLIPFWITTCSLFFSFVLHLKNALKCIQLPYNSNSCSRWFKMQ